MAAGAADAQQLPYEGLPLVVDTSAWTAIALLERKSPSHPLISVFEQALQDGNLHGCHMVDIELRHHARDPQSFRAVEEKLSRLHSLAISAPASRAAIAAQAELCEQSTAGHRAYHRVSNGDYLVAATAWHAGYGVLHYDHHFDRLGSVLGTASVWVLPAKTFEQIAATPSS